MNIVEAIAKVWDDRATASALLLAIALRERVAETGIDATMNELQAIIDSWRESE